VVETMELDQGWCHTVGYLSPILAAAAIGAHLSGHALDPASVTKLLASGARDEPGAERIAATLTDAAHLLVIASGSDRPAGRELTLKIEEAAWLPSAFRDLETFLHGHLPATGSETRLILILTDRDGRTERLARARQALAAARIVGLRAAAIVSVETDAALDPELTPAGRLIVSEAARLPAPVAALIGTTTPLQLLTERLARSRRTIPDLIRRDDPLYLAAAEAADG
jgi:fructoselysine-6-P-deglycase FrlB-like protein